MKYTFLTLSLLAFSLHVHAAQMANTQTQTRQTQIDTLFNILQYKSEGMVYESLRTFFQEHPDLASHAIENENCESFIRIAGERFKNNKELLGKIIELLLGEEDTNQDLVVGGVEGEYYAFRIDGTTLQQVAGPVLPSAEDITAVSEEEAQRFQKMRDENCRTQ